MRPVGGPLGVRSGAAGGGSSLRPVARLRIAACQLDTVVGDLDGNVDRMLRALGEYVIVGPTANIAFHRWALGHPAFRAGDIDTGFIARHFKPGALAEGTEADLPLIGAALAAMARAATVASANGARPPVPPRSRWRELARREALRE